MDRYIASDFGSEKICSRRKGYISALGIQDESRWTWETFIIYKYVYFSTLWSSGNVRDQTLSVNLSPMINFLSIFRGIADASDTWIHGYVHRIAGFRIWKKIMMGHQNGKTPQKNSKRTRDMLIAYKYTYFSTLRSSGSVRKNPIRSILTSDDIFRIYLFRDRLPIHGYMDRYIASDFGSEKYAQDEKGI